MLQQDAAGARASEAATAPYHFAARAKRVIFLFMKGGPSHVDTFDHKPLLRRDDGKPLPFAKPRVQFAATGNLLELAVEVQAVRPERHAGQRAVPARRRAASTTCACSTRCTAPTRPTAARCSKLHTGSDNFVRPSMGSWVTYGLGTENANLPGFVTICPTLAHGGVNNWGSAFLPAVYQGTPLGNASVPSRPGAGAVHRQPPAARATSSGCSSTCSPR